MDWLNEPSRWTQDAEFVRIHTDAETDFWRKTHDGGVRHNGHFYYETVDGDFTIQVKLGGEYRDTYDQAGLMVRVDETIWMKCGIEVVDGAQLGSVVVTRDWSDWSVVSLPASPSVRWKVSRNHDTLEVLYASGRQDFVRFRQTFLTHSPTVDVGIMACSPKGGGFIATFRELAIHRAVV